jgi:hypothetical protein
MSFTEWGVGQFRTVSNFVGSIWMPVGVMMNPRYLIVSIWKVHFEILAHRFLSRRHWRM